MKFPNKNKYYPKILKYIISFFKNPKFLSPRTFLDFIVKSTKTKP
jgi:hypothetical protein